MRNLINWGALFAIIASGFTRGGAGLADPGRPASAERAVSEAGSEVVVPVSVEAGEVILDVSINGRGPFPFIFDSGAQDALTPETVAALGLKTEGTGTVQDSGGHSVSITFTRVGAVRLGDAEMTDQPFLVLPLPRYERRPFDLQKIGKPSGITQAIGARWIFADTNQNSFPYHYRSS